MYCPIINIPIVGTGKIEQQCQKEKCAWWIDSDECAIVAIAYNILLIETHIYQKFNNEKPPKK